MPGRVAELNRLIDSHFEHTGGLALKPNPDFQPGTAAPTKSTGSTQGQVPKQCRIESIDGAIRVIAQGKNPFLGTAKVKLDGPITLHLQARGLAG